VADRLDVLHGLNRLVFEPDIKRVLKERSQLHRIVASQTWLFGEEFHLTLSDRNLTNVLRAALAKAGRSDVIVDDAVKTPEGVQGIVDLMCTRYRTRFLPTEREHLVVELKRPAVKIDDAAVMQAREYALAVVEHEQFSKTDAHWTFWVVSNDVTKSVQSQSRQRGRAQGVLQEDDRFTTWVKTWDEILDGARARLDFFQKQLSYAATDESALAHLREAYEKFLPDRFKEPATEPKPVRQRRASRGPRPRVTVRARER